MVAPYSKSTVSPGGQGVDRQAHLHLAIGFHLAPAAAAERNEGRGKMIDVEGFE
jgi:hypothetical protein